MKATVVFAVVCPLLAGAVSFGPGQWTQERLEQWLANDEPQDDYVNEPEPEYVPLRNQDSLREFSSFITTGGWTTNQLVEGFIFAVTNNMTDARWGISNNREVAWRAVSKLAATDHPVASNFIYGFCTNDTRCMLRDALPGVFVRTNLEPDVLDYMRDVCIKTNCYDGISRHIAFDLIETLQTMPNSAKVCATNRLASYFYFAVRHVTQEIGCQDDLLVDIIPSYSNSVQRLNAMRYVSSTATNTYERARAQREVSRLSALTNLVNLSWLENPQ